MVSSFEGRYLHPAERVVVMAAKDTQLADHLRGLQSLYERPAMSGEAVHNAPVPLRVQVFFIFVHFACIAGLP